MRRVIVDDQVHFRIYTDGGHKTRYMTLVAELRHGHIHVACENVPKFKPKTQGSDTIREI